MYIVTNNASQSLNAVTAYFSSSKQLPHFDFAEQIIAILQ